MFYKSLLLYNIVMIKKIYAVLEFGDYELRLAIGEFYNTKLNILKLITKPIKAFNGFEIVNEEEIIKNLQTIIREANEDLGTTIESVILVLPSYRFKKRSLMIDLETSRGIVSYEDVKKAIESAAMTPIDEDRELINIVCNRFIVNGISNYSLPLKERAKEISIDIDLLLADKKLSHDYVAIVEKAGLKILDICLDTYAVCKETGLFTKTTNQNVILLKIEKSYTSFAFITRSKIMNIEIMNHGLNDLVVSLRKKYDLSYSQLLRLVKYQFRQNLNNESDNAIYAYQKDSQKKIIEEKQFNDDLNEAFNSLITRIHTTCEPLLELANTSILVCGEGCIISDLDNILYKKLGLETKIQIPDTLGVKEASLSSLVGAFYAYYDNDKYLQKSDVSIDLIQFNKVINKEKEDKEAKTFTDRIKDIFNSKKEENK